MVSAAAPPTPRLSGPVSERCAETADPGLAAYTADDGYAGARRAYCELEPGDVVALVEASGLQARGRWSSTVGDEWRRLLAAGAGPRSVVCYAGRPGLGHASDRMLVERAPHAVLDGLLVAARAMGADVAHLCLAVGHEAGLAAVASAVSDAKRAGYVGPDVFGGGTAFEVEVADPAVPAPCGDGTAILEALEGHVACPRARSRPPAATTRGLAGRPCWIVDPETCAQIALIGARGSDWLRERGEDAAPGTAIFEVSGPVERPGLYELPLGTRLGTLVFEHAGGVAGGRKVGAVLPGGVAAPALSPGALDVPLTDEALRAQGSALGSAHVVVVDDDTCMVATALEIGAHFRGISCGHAVHCREGTLLIHALLGRVAQGNAAEADLTMVTELCDELGSDDHCGIADGVAAPVRSLVNLFRDDFEAHLHGDGCGRGREVALG